MKTVVATKIQSQVLGTIEVARRQIKVRNAVELATVANVGVDRLTRRFRAFVEPFRAAEGRQGSTDDLDPTQVQSADDLAIAGDDLVGAAARVVRITVCLLYTSPSPRDS